MKKYVLGFLFDSEFNSICLMRKNRPTWQAGLLNGVGGKIEPGEPKALAMSREFEEETGVKIPANKWLNVVTLYFNYAQVDVFCEADTTLLWKTRTTTDEAISKINFDELDKYPLIENVPYLIALCIQRLTDREGVAPKNELARIL